jgi:hypothetical protein
MGAIAAVGLSLDSGHAGTFGGAREVARMAVTDPLLFSVLKFDV